MLNISNVSLIELLSVLSDVMDFIMPEVVAHGKEVASIAAQLALELDLPPAERQDIVYAAILHDIGTAGLTGKERSEAFNFEFVNPHHHANIGYQLVKSFTPFRRVAELIRFHHAPHSPTDELYCRHDPELVPRGSHLIHLADRIAVLVKPNLPILNQREAILQTILEQRGRLFRPELVDLFESLAAKESFWLDFQYETRKNSFFKKYLTDPVEMTRSEIYSLADFFRRLIDFRSRFTSAHSYGVSACAVQLAGMIGFSENERQLVNIAGFVHDLGKISVPLEILEKPGPLTKLEVDIVRTHPYYGFKILEDIPFFSQINMWGSMHHEVLDGTGYPFRLKSGELPLGSRVMAVADIFTALMENRPYRNSLDLKSTLGIMQELAMARKIDLTIVRLLQENADVLARFRQEAHEQSEADYAEFLVNIRDQAD